VIGSKPKPLTGAAESDDAARHHPRMPSSRVISSPARVICLYRLRPGTPTMNHISLFR